MRCTHITDATDCIGPPYHKYIEYKKYPYTLYNPHLPILAWYLLVNNEQSLDLTRSKKFYFLAGTFHSPQVYDVAVVTQTKGGLGALGLSER